MVYHVLEICAGAGGQAIGLEAGGFENVAAVEIDANACQTLKLNRPSWNVIQDDIANLGGLDFRGVDLLAGGLPCPPFSVAGKQHGPRDERDLFPEALRIIRETKPRAVMLENVPGFASAKFDHYRSAIIAQLETLNYTVKWRILNASDYGVPQLRPRFVLVALQAPYASYFDWPSPSMAERTVAEAIGDLMAARGWQGAELWQAKAARVAPTLVGGSKKHGGPDLGPTRAKRQWEQLGVDGHGVADEPPAQDFPLHGMPRLTVRMAARLQSFPDDWQIVGRKTPAYRQVGNAFPSRVAQRVAESIITALNCRPQTQQGATMKAKRSNKQGSKTVILQFFLENKGRIIEGEEIRQVANVSEWARRVRELRDEDGYQILTHRDRSHLKPGQYLLETDKRRPVFPSAESA